jgi:hypothetical protein
VRIDRAHTITGECVFEGDRGRDALRQPDEAARSRNEPALHFRQAKLSIFGGDYEVARERKFTATGKSKSFHGRNERLRRGPLGQSTEAPAFQLGAFSRNERLKIHAGAEVARSTCENAGAKLWLGIEPVKGVRDRLRYSAVDGIALLRPIDRNDQRCTALLDVD